jgi:hypothetical protein
MTAELTPRTTALRALRTALVALAFAGTAAAAKAPASLTGTWIADLSTQDASQMVDDYLVAGGRYVCRSCEPPRDYAADGQPHAVPGDSEVTSESVTVLNDHAIRTRIVSSTRVRVTTMTVAADNKTATYVAIDHRTDIPGVLRTEYLAQRIAPAPPGANRVSGQWRGVRYVSVPKVLRQIDLKVDAKTFTYRHPSGVHYTAVIDGAPAPVETPTGVTSQAAVKRVDARTYVETRFVAGKLVMRRTYTLSADGRALEVATYDPASKITFRATSRRE